MSQGNLNEQESGLLSYTSSFPESINENEIKCPFLDLNTHASEYTREKRGKLDDVVSWQLARATTRKPQKKREPQSQQSEYTQSIKALFYNQDYEPQMHN